MEKRIWKKEIRKKKLELEFAMSKFQFLLMNRKRNLLNSFFFGEANSFFQIENSKTKWKLEFRIRICQQKLEFANRN